MGRKQLLFFFSALVLFTGALTRVDRVFFKRNHSFCVRFIYPSIENQPEWDLPAPTATDVVQLDEILKQKFHYLAKGCHCYAFISEDKNYVIKFHRYASHLRVFPWLNHPFAYHFSKKRKATLEHNIRKLNENLLSYRNCAQALKEETGLVMLHINRSESLQRYVTLVDATGASYRVSLDDVTFILQRKADLIYPTLNQCVLENDMTGAKKAISAVIQLITDCCKKGYVDHDPVLRKNYGLIEGRAIHIDVGDLVKNEAVRNRENYIPHVKEMTASLRVRLEKEYPKELLAHYDQEIGNL